MLFRSGDSSLVVYIHVEVNLSPRGNLDRRPYSCLIKIFYQATADNQVLKAYLSKDFITSSGSGVWFDDVIILIRSEMYITIVIYCSRT